jgi:L-ascorbate metabolism protein UlaG (beta-lactamase superfamily)
MKFTYYGHSCFSVLAGGKTLLFDPFVMANQLARAIDVDRIEADFIFVSHGHFDHTTDVARIAKRTVAKVLEIGNYLIGSKKAGWKIRIPSIQADSSRLISERSRALPRNIRAACPTVLTAV